MASLGVLVGNIGRSTYLFNIVRSPQTLELQFDFTATTIGWVHCLGSETGVMTPSHTILSKVAFTASLWAKGIGRALWIANGFASSRSLISIEGGGAATVYNGPEVSNTSLYSSKIFFFISSISARDGSLIFMVGDRASTDSVLTGRGIGVG